MKDVPLSHRFYPEMTYLLNQKVIKVFRMVISVQAKRLRVPRQRL